ncbi:MAG: S1/P1 nuclease [Oligoflexia bacterium]|nr:S1/P1 nuclease [Oligoflexia bacterium]
MIKIFLLILFVTVKSYGWGDLGHQTVAEIASKHISAKTKAAIEKILAPEPLAAAAIWPDIVRGDKRFSMFAPYHYSEVPEGKTYDTMEKHEHAAKDAMTVIVKYPELIKNVSSSKEQKMIALRYIIHVVGDVHQPLHVGNGKDKGGNDCLVVWQNPKTKFNTNHNLHSMWDDTLIEQFRSERREKLKNFYGYDIYAKEILKKYENLKDEFDKIKSKSANDWFNESIELRDSLVYPANPEKYCKKNVLQNDKPILSNDYYQKAIPVIEKRLLYGGIRLAKVLDDIFASFPNVQSNDMEVLNSLQLTNH